MRARKGISKVYAIIMICIVVVAGIVAAWYLTRPAPPKIKIGWPVPITGAIAPFGEPDPWIAEEIEEFVNEELGGIYIEEYGKKIPIEILVRDTKSDSDFAATVATDLITREEIDLMVVLHTPGTTVPVCIECEKYDVPTIALDTPVLSWLTGAPYEWSFLAFWTEPDVAEIFMGMWEIVRGETSEIACGLWSDDPDGLTFRVASIALAEERGYEFVDSGLAPYGTLDFSPYIMEWKGANAELLTGNFIPPDFATLWTQCYELGFVPKVATIGRSILFPPAVEALGGDLPLGLTTEVWWSPYHPFESSLTGQTAEELSEAWEEESGKQWTQPLGYSHAAFEVAVDVLERAGTLDKTELRDAIAETDLETIVGPINFKKPLSSEEVGRYTDDYPELITYADHYSITPVVGGQWVEGTEWTWELELVYNWKYDDIPETADMILIPS